MFEKSSSCHLASGILAGQSLTNKWTAVGRQTSARVDIGRPTIADFVDDLIA